MISKAAQPVKMGHLHRRSGVTLVHVGDCYALVDGRRERLWVLNQDGAHVWTRLGTGEIPDPQSQDFLSQLAREGLLQEPPNAEGVEPVERSGAPPAILATSPLQVAAGNSIDPFADPGW